MNTYSVAITNLDIGEIIEHHTVRATTRYGAYQWLMRRAVDMHGWHKTDRTQSEITLIDKE